MNGLLLCSLTPDADAPLMTPRSALYCELGLIQYIDNIQLCINAALTPLIINWSLIFANAKRTHNLIIIIRPSQQISPFMVFTQNFTQKSLITFFLHFEIKNV